MMKPKRITFYRSTKVIEKRRKQGEKIFYANIFTDVKNRTLRNKFLQNPNLESVDVVEECSPFRFRKGRGFSDHFAISMKLKF